MISGWFAAGHDLILLTPTMGEPPPPLGTFDDSGPDPLKAFDRAEKSGIFTALLQRDRPPSDLAAAALRPRTGCPIGVQLVADHGREDVLLRVAAQLEEAHPWAGQASRRAGPARMCPPDIGQVRIRA